MKRLRELRTQRDLKQKDIAEFLGVDRTTYVKYETGASEPNFNSTKKLADYFNCTVDYLLGYSDISREPTLNEQLEDIEFTLAGEIHGMTDTEKRDVLKYVKFIKSQREKCDGE